MSFSDWMLALHLLSAFAVAAALVLYGVLVVAGRRMQTLEETRILFRVAPIGTILITVGSIGTLVLGVVLAFDRANFHIYDAWIIAAIVLWAALGGIGQRSGMYYQAIEKLSGDPANETEVFARLRASTGATLHAATVGVFILLLLDMIIKPGA